VIVYALIKDKLKHISRSSRGVLMVSKLVSEITVRYTIMINIAGVKTKAAFKRESILHIPI
jgi:hypothetical protein